MTVPAVAVPSTKVGGVLRLKVGASLTSVVAGTLTVALVGVVPSVTVTATGGKSLPALTKAAPAAVKLT